MADFQAFDATTHPIVKLEDDWNNLLAHGLVKPASYVVHLNGSYYEAINGSTGLISYGGADNAGAADGTDAKAVLQAAINAGQKIIVKDMTATLSDAISVSNANRVIRGFGVENTKLVGAAGVSIFDVTADYVSIEHMTLDTDTNAGHATVAVGDANHCTLRNLICKGSDQMFTVYWVGPTGATLDSPTYDKYNRMINCKLYDKYDGDGLSLSFQQHFILQNIYEEGSRLAVYGTRDSVISNYTFKKGAGYATNFNGIWVTNPCYNLEFNKILLEDAGTPYFAETAAARTSEKININGLIAKSTTNNNSFDIIIDNARSVSLSNLQLENSCTVTLYPNCQDIHIAHSPRLPSVVFSQGAAETLTGIHVNDCTFPTFTARGGQNQYALVNFNNGSFVDLIIRNNKIYNTNALYQVIEKTGVFVDHNRGYVTENSGTATILNTTTSIPVTHGCDYTPSAGDIDVHPIETLNLASFWYVDTITSTQFTIHVNVDPGQDVDFKWSVRRI